MRCDQKTVDEIIDRAKRSNFGLDSPERPVVMANYAPMGAESLAIALVGAYYEKYDLVALMQAAMEEAFEQGARSASPPNEKDLARRALDSE